MKKLSLMILSLVLVINGMVCAAGGVLSGNGTAGAPYLIEDLADFDVFADEVNAGTYWAEGVYAKLTSDVDLDTIVYDQSVISTYYGDFDGDGHVISNLKIRGADSVGALGLFGWLSAGSVVRNLGLEDVDVQSGNNLYYVGSLCGAIYGEGAKVEGCYSTGSVIAGNGVECVGGLCGRVANDGVLTDSYSMCTVSAGSGSNHVGGLCGGVNGSVFYCYAEGDVSGQGNGIGGLCGGIGVWSGDADAVSNSYATGSVSGGNEVGGFCGIGTMSSEIVSNCYAAGAVSGADKIGGFIGFGSAINCFATGNVTGTSKVGGFVGYGGAGNSYAMGEVIGFAEVGGFVGKMNSDISYCYSIGKAFGNSYTNGFCGKLEDGVFEGCFWDVEVSGIGSSGDLNIGALGKTTAEMQARQTYIDADWKLEYKRGFSSREVIVPEWYMAEGSYPQLYWMTASEILPGKGSNYAPFLIENMAHFDKFCNTKYFCHAGVCTKLMCDIDLVGRVYDNSPIAPQYSNPDDGQIMLEIGYAGVFDGNGHVIRNISIESDVNNQMQCVGLFGRMKGENAEIRNLGVGNVQISNYELRVQLWDFWYGGLCGSNEYGTIRNCYSTGAIGGLGKQWIPVNSSINCFTGGLCGRSLAGEIIDSYSSCYIAKGGGGLCGWNRGGTITNSYATGDIAGGGGGLCGYSLDYSLFSSIETYSALIKDSYATGNVSGNRYVGGLIARNCALVENCYATGDVEGIEVLGGFVGSNESDIYLQHGSLISNCYATGNVYANIPGDDKIERFSVGGFCGKNFKEIWNCYSEGNVIVNNESSYVFSNVGGFCGGNESTTHRIKYSYSTGAVSTSGNTDNIGGFAGYSDISRILHSFWDVESSGIGISAGGEGKTTVEMQDIDTFLDAGWDFVGEGGYGSEELWRMAYAMPGFPILAWQRDIAGDIAGGYGVDMEDAAMLASGWMEEYGVADLEELAKYWLAGK